MVDFQICIFRFVLVLRSIHKFGKTKCSYFINYGLALYIKEQLEKDTISSSLYLVSFDESMNSILQN